MPKKEKKKEGAPEWMVTFGDMMALLLTFFVLLFSMATISPKKFAEVLGAIQTILGAGSQATAVPRDVKPQEVLRKLMRVTEDPIKQGGTMVQSIDGVEFRVAKVDEGLKITFGGKPLFDVGKAELREEYTRASAKRGERGALDLLASMIKGYRNKIRIIGHTAAAPEDSFPGPEGKWKLGAARGTSVMRWLVNNRDIHPARIEVASAGQYQPAVSELDGPSPDAAKETNRRVEVIITEQLVPWERLN